MNASTSKLAAGPNGQLRIRDSVDAQNPAKILIVEDDLINVKVLKGMLALAGLRSAEAHDGCEALEKLIQEPDFDLVLMDVRMPVMSGLQATRQIRNTPALLHIPIIAVTTNSHEQGRAECFAAGMNDFVAKPVMPAEFFAALKKWLPAKGIDWPESLVPQKTPVSEVDASYLELLSDALEDIPSLDTGQCDKLMNGDSLAYARLLRQFVTSHKDDRSSIDAAIRSADMETAVRIAHTVKGAAGTLGMEKLQEAAYALEMQLKDDPLDNQREDLMSAFEQSLLNYAEHIINLPEAPVPAAAVPVDEERMFMLATELQSCLQAHDSKALDLWETYLGEFESWLGKSQAVRIGNEIDQFNFLDARKLIEDVLTNGVAK